MTQSEAKIVREANEPSPSRGTISLSGEATLALDLIAKRLGMTRLPVAALLLENMISNQLVGTQAGLKQVTDRTETVLQRYGLNALTMSYLLGPKVPPSALLDAGTLLDTLHATNGTSIRPVSWLTEQFHVPLEWLLGQTDRPARPWIDGSINAGSVLYTMTRPENRSFRLLLIHPTGYRADVFLEHSAPTVFVALEMETQFPEQHGIPVPVRHITPIGITQLSLPSNRQGLLAVLAEIAEKRGYTAESIAVPQPILDGLKSGDLHPDAVLLNRNYPNTMLASYLQGPQQVISPQEWREASSLLAEVWRNLKDVGI